jgi:hypothetical protein
MMLVALSEFEFAGVALASERANKVIIDADAVLRAADEWVAAHEALLSAHQSFRETEEEEERVDIAGARLAVTVKRWRAQSPPGPEEVAQLRQSHVGWR